jgi:hypothetical protein
VRPAPPAVSALAARLTERTWFTDLWVAGSLASGDYVPGTSDLDLVALVDLVPPSSDLVDLHRELDGRHPDSDLGCAYVSVERLTSPDARHPTGPTAVRCIDRCRRTP